MPEHEIDGLPDYGTHWHFRDYEMNDSSFMTAITHLYRGEVTRASMWRRRLDVTTNWSIVVTGAAISFAFNAAEVHHSAIFLFALLVTLFLFIEARRYQYYELWSYRARLIEADFFATLLVPPFKPRFQWSHRLANSLLYPRFPITFAGALGHRLRKNYFWIYLVLEIAWIGKLLLFPTPVAELDNMLDRANVGRVTGLMVVMIQVLFFSMLIIVILSTRHLDNSAAEMIQQDVNEIVPPEKVKDQAEKTDKTEKQAEKADSPPAA